MIAGGYFAQEDARVQVSTAGSQWYHQHLLPVVIVSFIFLVDARKRGPVEFS
jgi:hypothetical protein